MPTSVRADDNTNRRRTGVNNADGGDRIIDGLRYPRQERQIDPLGFELTTHGLHFHGHDWDIPLTQKRDELTKAFIQDAAAATNEPEENIRNLRFIVTRTHLDAKLMVRHKVYKSKHEVQEMLSSAKWSHVKALYEPRQKMPRPKASAKIRPGGAGDDQTLLGLNRQTTSHNLSFFGRANVGAEGPEFVDHHDDSEEPAAYEDQQNAKLNRAKSGLFISVSLAA
ncbi:hypothetical protein JKF63_04252 [Porcisia hertigi]|uniref:Flagellar attachment zone protein 1 conserved domain-containing protein n=1 Tax=Porcisia hertigi TaxID=2761500 RepID=A0A836L7N3_9TRYP|nr:hypothetical protein JKF63_04252 [Porcisia hertigi]